MKWVVVGAGAVGGYFGGRLAQAGVDVTFLVRGKRAAQLQETGLVLRSTAGDGVVIPQVVTSVAEIDACDVVVFAVKNYHLEGVLDTVRPLVERGAKVLPLLNGIGHLEVLREAFGEERVLGGFCNIIVTLGEQGEIVHTSQQHNYTFGALVAGQEAFCAELYEVAKGAQVELVHSDQVYRDMWQKYMFIGAVSGVTTASRLTMHEVLACPPTRAVLRNAFCEFQALAAAHGAVLPEGLPDQMLAGIETVPKGSTSSMHQDFRKGFPIECESLQGTAVRLGEQVGVRVPTLQTLYGLLKPYENGGMK